MISLNFYTIAERKPEHRQDIVWLRRRGVFEATGFELRECTVEYQWTELDEQGDETGCVFAYDGECDVRGRLDIIFDDWVAIDDLWCPVDEYWGAFDNVHRCVSSGKVEQHDKILARHEVVDELSKK